MIIQRQNIFGLIGKNKSKYSSCIITSYSIDFTFFEERAMSILRAADIKNINLFIDGKYLDNHFENDIGAGFKSHRTYSLNPIYESGVFHPKIILLTGPKHGLLIIGSGNLTSSGISTNDEIWGAFHLNSIDSKNASIFASVWNYLQQYLIQSNGYNSQKLAWISQYSPWIKDLPGLLTNEFIKINNWLEVCFIGNTKVSSHYQIIRSRLPGEKIKKLTIIAPYFDEKGEALKLFLQDYKINKTVCITDCEFGLLPTALSKEISESINFYDWKKCLDDFDVRYNRLHAKIFHFEYENGWEYLLLGSANATLSAWGTQDSLARNSEAGILLRRKSSNTFLQQLGISTKKAVPFDLKKIKKKITQVGAEITPSQFKYKIIFAEINGDNLDVYLKEALEKNCELTIINSNGVEVERIKIPASQKTIRLELKKTVETFKVFISEGSVRISNYTLIHNVILQSKCNPDSRNAELQQIIESFGNDPENDKYIELLRHVDYNWVDEEFLEEKTTRVGAKKSKDLELEENKQYDKLTEQEYNNLNSLQSKAQEVLNNPSVQIADILHLISKGLNTTKNVQDNPEEVFAGQCEEEQTGEGDDVLQVKKKQENGELIRNAIYNHLDKVARFYSRELEFFYSSGIFKDTSKRSLSIRDLSNISISLDLIDLFYGKKYSFKRTEFVINFNKQHAEKIERIEKEYRLKRLEKTNIDHKSWVYYEIEPSLFNKLQESLSEIDKNLLVPQEEYTINTYYEDYLLPGAYNSETKYGLKYYLIELLGSYLICSNSNAGFRHYDYDFLNDKSIEFRRKIFKLASFLCLNILWSESELNTRNILLLDILNFINPDLFALEDISKVDESLVDYDKQCNYKCESFDNNKQFYLQTLLPAFIDWHKKFVFEKTELLESISHNVIGKIIFNSNIGFTYLKNRGDGFLLIEKPGIAWNYSVNGNILRITYPQQKIIVF